jgi:asparagine synthase (glutamine-hydrolysing)
MCGLAGEIRFDGRRADVAAIERANDVLAPRGPDGGGVWWNGSHGVASRRLSIIDPSPAGAQPMVDPELGLTIAFNGCIYDHTTLRAELEGLGHTFRSRSDTEVIAKAYAQWGVRCVERFHGMFVFAIFEHESGRLVLARDRLGVKPLYVDHTPERLRFASTLPALLAAGGVDTSIDVVALSHYLSLNAIVPSPQTIITGVRKLPPATVRVIETDGTTRDTVYWNLRFERTPERAGWSDRDWQDALLDALRVAVRRRFVSDLPVGILLSGGLDSSLLVALASEAGEHRLPTFSIGFNSMAGVNGDEFAYSDLVAHRFDTDHHRIEVSSSSLLHAVSGAVASMSEPMVSPDCVAFYLLAQETSRHVKVVQGGQGADELLAGYHWYPKLSGVPRDDADGAYRDVFFDRTHQDLAALLEPDWMTVDDEPWRLVQESFARSGATTTLDAALRIDTQVMLVDDPLKRLDNMTMASGVEAREPFLDHELVELAATIPPELKLAHGGKGVLKGAARGLLPAEVIDRDKGYFRVPELRHLDAPYVELVREALSDPVAKRRGLFRPAIVESMLDDPDRHRTPIGANALWQLGLLEMWLQAHGIT